MAIKKILKYPDPQLRVPTIPVMWPGSTDIYIHSFPSGRLSEFIGDLTDTLVNTDNGLAIAANQVYGGGPRLFVLNPKLTDFIQAFQTNVVVNPYWKPLSSTKVTETEGCLSFPELQLPIARHTQIEVYYQNLDGQRFTLPVEGLAARAVQHEVEHLDGKLFIDHLPKRKQFEIRSLALKHRKAGK